MSLNFYLSDLDTSADASSAQLSGLDIDAHPETNVIATVDLSASLLQSLFNFYTDDIDVTDPSTTDIKYRVAYNTLPTALGIDINANTEVEGGSYFTSSGLMYVTFDYVRYLAFKLFNTHYGTDLFSNEEFLRTDLQTTFATNFDTVLTALQSAGEKNHEETVDNPSRKLLNHIINNVPSRLNDISGNYSIEGEQYWYKMPILAGDNVYMVLTVSAAPDQNVLTNVASIEDRTYLIRIAAV